jgi:shikimate kinase
MKNNSRRPLLAGKTEQEMSDAIDSLMEKREEVYRSTASYIYDTTERRMGKVLKEFGEIFPLQAR